MNDFGIFLQFFFSCQNKPKSANQQTFKKNQNPIQLLTKPCPPKYIATNSTPCQHLLFFCLSDFPLEMSVMVW